MGETAVKTNEKVGDSREEEWGRERGGRRRGGERRRSKQKQGRKAHVEGITVWVRTQSFFTVRFVKESC